LNNKVETIGTIPGIQAQTTVEGQIYYKAGGIFNEKIVAFVQAKCRETSHYDEVKGLFEDLSFLQGVLGNALIFDVVDSWYDKPATAPMKGKWIHHSIILPLVSMNSGAGLKYVIDTNLYVHHHMSEQEKEINRLVICVVQGNDKIRVLEDEKKAILIDADNSVDAAIDGALTTPFDALKYLEAPKDEQMGLFPEQEFGPVDPPLVTLEVSPHAKPGQKSLGYTLAFLNNMMKVGRVNILRNYTGYRKYSEVIEDICLTQGWVTKVDESHYKSNGKCCYLYTPSRANNYNEDKSLKVRLFGITPHGLKQVLAVAQREGYIEPINIIYLQNI
jgi:hypothetical protein